MRFRFMHGNHNKHQLWIWDNAENVGHWLGCRTGDYEPSAYTLDQMLKLSFIREISIEEAIRFLGMKP